MLRGEIMICMIIHYEAIYVLSGQRTCCQGVEARRIDEMQ